jgi:hypothetical protein
MGKLRQERLLDFCVFALAQISDALQRAFRLR